MEKMSIAGETTKDSFYLVLEWIDQLKTQGWYIHLKTRLEKNDQVNFNYILHKRKKP